MISGAWREAKTHLAGGVNSPVRAFRAVGGEPVFMRRGKGPYLFDVRGQKYIDYCLSWGAILTGHADPYATKAIREQAARGTSFGTVTEGESALAAEIKKAFPGMQRMRFTSSGTEAVMSALRLARGVTKRKRIVKFEGCYHGHADGMLVKAGSGLATFCAPDSEGVPEEIARLTLVLPYNDASALTRVLKRGSDIACVIVEPLAANMGLVPAKKEFLEALRKATKKIGALLIFDEVVSGYRVGFGGAQHLYGVRPDITVLGKIIGGGLPIGAFGGAAPIMRALSPGGKVYQAGTLSGNPLSMAAGLGVLQKLSEEFYRRLNGRTTEFLEEARAVFRRRGRAVAVQGVGSMFTIFFSARCPQDFQEVRRIGTGDHRRFFHRMLRSGVYMPPSAFETCFVSAAHGLSDFETTLQAFKQC